MFFNPTRRCALGGLPASSDLERYVDLWKEMQDARWEAMKEGYRFAARKHFPNWKNW